MIEPTTLGKDTYALPASYEASLAGAERDAYNEAIRSAINAHPVDPETVTYDTRRAETVGASIVTAAETSHPSEVVTNEEWWNDPEFMKQISRLPVAIRARALRNAGITQSDFTEAA